MSAPHRPFLAAVVVASLVVTASACPICDSETGRQVRAGIFGDDFWSTLLIVASPFPVLLLAIAAYHFDWLKFGRRAGSEPARDQTALDSAAS